MLLNAAILQAPARTAGRRAADGVARLSAGGRTGGRAFAPSSRRSDLSARAAIRRPDPFGPCALPRPGGRTATTFMSSRPTSTGPATATCRWRGRSISRASRSPTFRAAGCGGSTGRRRCAARSPHRSAASMSCICTPSISGRSGPARAPRGRSGVPYVDLAARHARARADPPQEPVGEGGLDRADRARQPRGGRRHPCDVVGRGGPSRGLRLEAAARSPPSRTASTIRRRLPAAPLSPDIAAAIARRAARAGVRPHQLGEGARSADRGAAAGADRAARASPATMPMATLRRWRRRRALLGVDGRVTIIARHVEGADKEALFAAARMFAMTSLSENFGIAAFEAMRRGVPVLTTPDVGMSEIVRESGAGRVVDAAPAAIAGGLNAMLADPAGSRAMGEAGPRPCRGALWLAERSPAAWPSSIGSVASGRRGTAPAHDGPAGAKPVRSGDRAPGRHHCRLAAAGFRRRRAVHADARPRSGRAGPRRDADRPCLRRRLGAAASKRRRAP